MAEEWKDIEGYEGMYLVSNLGNIKDKEGKDCKYVLRGKGYCNTRLYFNGKRKNNATHRLVAQAFLPNPENKMQVNHKNGIKIDNCIDNLEWCTAKENIQHSYKEKLNSNSNIDNKEIIKELYNKGIKQNLIAFIVGTDQGTISRILNNKRFNYV